MFYFHLYILIWKQIYFWIQQIDAHRKFILKQNDTVNFDEYKIFLTFYQFPNFYGHPISSISKLVLNCEQVLEFQPLFKYDDV